MDSIERSIAHYKTVQELVEWRTRAEQAEARIAALEAENERLRAQLNANCLQRDSLQIETARLRAEIGIAGSPPPEGSWTQRLLLSEARVRALEEDVIRLGQAILWADGQHEDFPPREPGQGLYWWRKELMRRAGLRPTTPTPEGEQG